jgi:O-antigen/teichoic acid export membrane protein
MSLTFKFSQLSAALGSDSTRARLARGGLKVGVLKAFSMVAALVTSVVLARGMSPEGYGAYSFFLALVVVSSLPFGSGVANLLTREAAVCRVGEDTAPLRALSKRVRWSAAFVSLALFLAASVGIFHDGEWNLHERWELLLIAGLVSPLLAMTQQNSGIIRGFGGAAASQVPNLLLRPATQLLVVSTLILLGTLSPGTAVASQGVAIIVALTVSELLVRRVYPAPGAVRPFGAESGPRIVAMIPFILLAISETLNTQVGILLLGLLGGDADVSGLRLADRGATLISFPLVVANVVIGPVVARLYRAGNHRHLLVLYKSAARFALTCAVLIAAPILLLTEELLAAVVGHEYVVLAAEPLKILAIGHIINVAFGSVGTVLVMTGHERLTMIGQVMSLALNVGLALVLIPRAGAFGAAVAAATAQVTWNVYLGVQLRRQLRMWPTAL